MNYLTLSSWDVMDNIKTVEEYGAGWASVLIFFSKSNIKILLPVPILTYQIPGVSGSNAEHNYTLTCHKVGNKVFLMCCFSACLNIANFILMEKCSQ